MGNAQKPTSRTQHINIKYFALCGWIERDPIHLKRTDTAINNAHHLTKSLSCILIHRHVDYLLEHIPPRYSPAHDYIVKNYTNTQNDNIVQYIPIALTTPSTVTASRVFAPTLTDINGSPWLPPVLWNEDYNPY